MNSLSGDLLSYIVDFIYNTRTICLCDVKKKQHYTTQILLNKFNFVVFWKPCKLRFNYTPMLDNSALPKLLECTYHYNNKNNNIHEINLLNNMKLRYLSNRRVMDEIKMGSRENCEFVLKYLKEFKRIRAFMNDNKDGIHVVDPRERFNLFL